MKTLTLVLTALFLSGCSIKAKLYPVEGPILASGKTAPLQAKASGVWSDTGEMTVITETGETCTGDWSSSGGATVSSSTSSMFGTYGGKYGSAYGSGMSFSSTNNNPGRAVVVCESGNIFDIEFLSNGNGHGHGFGKDRNGNVYRLIF